MLKDLQSSKAKDDGYRKTMSSRVSPEHDWNFVMWEENVAYQVVIFIDVVRGTLPTWEFVIDRDRGKWGEHARQLNDMDISQFSIYNYEYDSNGDVIEDGPPISYG